MTQDEELAEQVRLLRSHGEKPRYKHRIVGTTARLDAIQAAVLRAQAGAARRLERPPPRPRRGACARSLAGSAVDPSAHPGPWGDHVYHLFVVRTRFRDALREHLARAGIATAVHYPDPIHLTGAYADLGVRRGSLPVSEALAEQICTLPMWPGMTDEAVRRIGHAVRSFAGGEDAAPGDRFARAPEAAPSTGRW